MAVRKFHRASKRFWLIVAGPAAVAIVVWPAWSYWPGIILLVSIYANWKSDWGAEHAVGVEQLADQGSLDP